MSTGSLITDFFPKRKRAIYSNEPLKKFKKDGSESFKSTTCQKVVRESSSKRLCSYHSENSIAIEHFLETKEHDLGAKNLMPTHQSILDAIKTNVDDFYKISKEKKEKFLEVVETKSDEAPTFNNKSLKLPTKYYTLLDIFKSSDHIVSIYYNRNETCWFPKLKSGVEQIRRKRFSENELSQICTVYPNAYVISLEKLGSSNQFVLGSSADKYQLTIKPVLTPEKSLINATKNVFNPQILIKRRAIFYQNLINIVKKHHRKFLKSLKHPVEIDENKLTNWHPEFDLNNLPDITLSKLPKCHTNERVNLSAINLKQINSFMSPRTQRALDMVSLLNSKSPTSPFSLRYQSQSPLTPKSSHIQNSLERTPTQLIQRAVSSVENPHKSVTKSLNFYTPQHNTSPHLKGVSSKLVNMIREKEATRIELKLTRDIDEENKVQLYTKLPDLVRIIRNFYVSENKSTISVVHLIKRLMKVINHPLVLHYALYITLD